MIADFVAVKKRLYQFLNIVMVAEMKKHAPLMAMSQHHVIHEGDASSYETVSHETKELDLQEAQASFSLTRDEMGAITFQEVIGKMCSCAADMARQIEQRAFKTIDEVVASTGNTVVASEFGLGAMLEMLEKIQIDFDDTREKPSMPSMLLSPEMIRKLQEADRAMTEEARREFETKKEAVLDRKFEEYAARERKRKLVD